MISTFVHTRLHSTYSLCEGALKIEKIIDLCEKFNMPAIALTDTNNLFGAMEFSIKASDHGIQPIIACQVNIKYDLDNIPNSHLLLYAKNENGYKNLMQIVTASHLESCSNDYPCVSMATLSKYSKNIITSIGNINSTLGHFLLHNKKDIAVSYLKEMIQLFPDNLFIEISRHHNPNENEIENNLINLAYDFNIPIIGTNNVCFENKQDFEAHDVLLCIGQSTVISENNRIKSSQEFYFKSPQEMIKSFEDIPEAIQNTTLLAEKCSYKLTPKKPYMPKIKTNSNLSQDELLTNMAEQGMQKRLDKLKNNPNLPNIKKQYQERMNYELSVIKKMGFSGYFLIVSDYVQWAKSHDIPVGMGRGSGAGSIVAYFLTITDVDPIKFNLLFERFLNPERISMPDFDIDFCQARREEVIHYVQQHYGYDSVAQIITFGQLQAKAVIKDAGRALGMPYGLTDKISKLIPFNPTNPLTLQQAIDSEKPLQEAINNDFEIQHLVDIALKLEGLCKHTSVHAAGVVISDRKIKDLAPLYKDPKATMPVTQFSMKYVESAGLIKFDFLGLKTLTVIKKIIDLLKLKNIIISQEDIPFDDKKTFNLLHNINCVGIFQIESSGVKDVIKKLQPDRIEDIIAIVALYRPGPMDNIPKYIACKHGIEKIVYPHPALEPILAETYGIMVYQEQVMQTAQVIAKYTLGQADILRRAMSKKNKEEMKLQEAKFIEGAKKNNVDEQTAKNLFEIMNKFASYGFNKSHAVCYGILTYHMAYLKANYPLEFFAAIMTLDMDNTEKIRTYCADLQKFNIKITPPNINTSGDDFIIDYSQNAIVYSLSALKGVGHAVGEAVEKARSSGKFKSIFDFVERLKPHNVINKRVMEALIKSGAFDSINNNRKQLINSIDIFLHTEVETNQFSLFGKIEPNLATVQDMSKFEKLKGEHEIIGVYLSAHPIDEYLEKIKNLGCSEILYSNKSHKARIAGAITSIQKKKTKNDSSFAIVNLSDKSGNIDVMIFSELLFSNIDTLQIGNVILIDVNIQINEDGSTRYTAYNIYDLKSESKIPPFEPSVEHYYISKEMKKISIDINSKTDLTTTDNILKNFTQGNISIELFIKPENKRILLKQKYKIGIKELLELQNKLGNKNVNHD